MASEAEKFRQDAEANGLILKSPDAEESRFVFDLKAGTIATSSHPGIARQLLLLAEAVYGPDRGEARELGKLVARRSELADEDAVDIVIWQAADRAHAKAPGAYRLEADADGFKKQVRGGLEVRVGDTLAVDVQLQVGGVSETVTVTEESPLLESATASVSSLVDRKMLDDLPLAGNNAMYAVALDSGAVLDGNHPLAGRNLHFEVDVLEVRDATADEIAHGHVHGPHGHDHS